MGRLPTELLRLIIAIVSGDEDDVDNEKRLATLSSICLASRLSCRIVTPYLYRIVHLQDARQAHLFLAAHALAVPYLEVQIGFLWCGVVADVLYDVPHRLLRESYLTAREVSWLQADSSGRYHGFHYVMGHPLIPSDAVDKSVLDMIQRVHIVCPDLGRWCVPLFSNLCQLHHVTISLYPRGNWDLEASKIEMILRAILGACTQLESVQILLAYTVAAAGSRTVRMTRAVPVSQAVNSIEDPRVTLRSADFMFGKYGWTSTDEVIEYTRMHWLDRLHGGHGPWPRPD